MIKKNNIKIKSNLMLIKKYIFQITIIIWIILDLLTKYLSNIYFQKKINIIGDFLYFKYVLNNWIAFSIKLNQFLLKIITISLIIWFFYYYLREEKKKRNLYIDFSFWLILAWAIWNAIERITKENVIDFIWVKYFSVFNVADSFITIWAILYIITLYIESRLKKIS
jgi:signal peptidase II